MSSMIQSLFVAASAALALGASSAVVGNAAGPLLPPHSLTRSASELIDVSVDWRSTPWDGIVQGNVRVENFTLAADDPHNFGQLPLKPVIGGVLSNGGVFMMSPTADGALAGTFYALEKDRNVYIEVRDAAGKMFATSLRARIN